MTADPNEPRAPLGWYTTRPPAISERRSRGGAMRRRTGLDALACLGLAALCFSAASRETLVRADAGLYARIPVGPPTIVALIVNVLGLAAVGLLAALAIRRVRHPVGRRVAAVAAAAALLIALNSARLAVDALRGVTDALGWPGLLALAGLALAASAAWPVRALWATRRLALIASPLAVLTLTSALWMFAEAAGGPVWRRVDPTPLKSAAPSLRRVVWIVFEELDPPPGLELPELDRLQREAVSTDAARAPGATTDLAMPSLITGRRVVAVAPLTPNDVELRFADGRRARWSAEPNVFGKARALGYDTAVVGWRLPYPRVLGASLGFGAWRPGAAQEQARGVTLREALRNQWGTLAPPLHVRRLSAERLAELGDLAFRAATDGRFGLVLLHLPLPRLPGVYDAATARLTAWNFAGPDAEALDNLALVDRVLGELRRGLERARLDDRTWLVVTSNPSPRDARVPFLVRPPDGSAPAHVDGEVSTLVTQELVLGVLRGSISDGPAAATWLRRAAARDPAAR